MQVVKVKDQNGFEFYLDRNGNPYTYDEDRLIPLLGLNGFDGFFKNVSDRLFRDLPKSIVNVVTSPFRSEPVYKPEDFQDSKYGASAGSTKNNAIVGAAGQIFSTAILGADAAKFNQAGTFVSNLIPGNQVASVTNSPADQTVKQPTVDQPISSLQKNLLVGGAALVLCSIGAFVYMAWEERQSSTAKKNK